MRWMTSLALLLTLTTACTRTEQPAAKPEVAATTTAGLPIECNPNSPCPGSKCLTAITAANAAGVPVDACPRHGEVQADVDVFAWNSFIALNWPADPATCGADMSKTILGPAAGPRVWETYLLDSSIFVPKGQQPAKWCDAAVLNAPRTFGAVSKSAGPAHMKEIDEAVGGVLTDQNGRFVRYEIRVNADEYNYITANQLWNKAGQVGKTISFPQTPTGAIEVKTAWKVLTPAEIASGTFYMTKGVVFNDENGTKSPGTNPVTLGLVGLHMLHRTTSAPNWFWATFEHNANTTSSFFNPNCTTCQNNQQTAAKPYKELNPNGSPVNQPVQVVRTTPIVTTDASAPPLNAYYQKLLAGTVWANYQLVSVQWATGGAPGGTPATLANTTLETFIQPTSSCIGCHKSAQTTSGASANFSFLLGAAQ